MASTPKPQRRRIKKTRVELMRAGMPREVAHVAAVQSNAIAERRRKVQKTMRALRGMGEAAKAAARAIATVLVPALAGVGRASRSDYGLVR